MKSPQAFRSIGEVARLVGVATHVLRYWETQFPALAPVRRPDGRRYYRPDDLLLAAGLCEVMREDGLTIRGAQRLIALDKGASLRDRGRLRLEAAAERKAEAAASRRRATAAPRSRARQSGNQGGRPAVAAEEADQTRVLSPPPGPGGQGILDGFGDNADERRPTRAPSARADGEQPARTASGAPLSGHVSPRSHSSGQAPSAPASGHRQAGIALPDPGDGAWLRRLTRTATALRAREHPLPSAARALHDALRQRQDGRP